MEVCSACHGLANDVALAISPNLRGFVSRKAGSTHYGYLPAMRAYGATWTPETLTAFLQTPRGVVPGATMAYPGIPDPAAGKFVADYLATLHDPT